MTDSAKQFWIWFQEINNTYLFLDQVDETGNERVLNDLSTALHNR
jgi:hypothetical protein